MCIYIYIYARAWAMYALYIPSLKDKSHALEKQSRVSAVFKDRSNPAAARRSPKQMIVQLNAWVLKKFQVASNFTIFSCFKQSFQTRGFIWIYRIHHTSHVSKRVTRHVHNWLVVSTPLKNHGVRQLGWWHSPYYGKNKFHVPNHQPDKIFYLRHWNVNPAGLCRRSEKSGCQCFWTAGATTRDLCFMVGL